MEHEDVPAGTRWKDRTPGFWEWDGRLLRVTTFDEGPALSQSSLMLNDMLRMESNGTVNRVPPTEAPAPTQPAPTAVAGGGAGHEHPYVVVNRVLAGWSYALDGMAELESRLVRAFVERDAQIRQADLDGASWLSMNWPEPRTPHVDAPCDEEKT